MSTTAPQDSRNALIEFTEKMAREAADSSENFSLKRKTDVYTRRAAVA